MDRREGEQIGKYRLIKLIKDANYYAQIYLAEDISNGNKVVIKFLSWNFAFEDKKEELLQVITQLQHPDILHIFSYNHNYLVTQYASKGSFRESYPKGKILPLGTVLSFAKQIVSAIQYIQDNEQLKQIEGFQHCFFNLEKLLIGDNGEILLNGFDATLDLNWGGYRLDSLNWVGYCLGNLDNSIPYKYFSPYLLAYIISTWLGISPSISLYSQNKEQALISLCTQNSAISLVVAEVIMKAFSENSKDRYESITAFAEALERAATSKRAEGINKQFGQYSTMRLLGQGDMGKTYLGEHIKMRGILQYQVVIKVLYDWYDKALFRSHAQKLTQLQHSNILHTRGYGVKDGSPYLVMDYAHRKTLLDLHPRGTILSMETILSYVKQTASALQYAHERNMYSDVRPKKLFAGPNNTILVSGFDIALNMGADPGRMVAKDYFEYRSPEQTQAFLSAACNQYALGIMAYEWLCGDVPFQGESVQIVYQHKLVTPPSLREKNSAIPHEVEEVVMKALAKNSEKRYESIHEFAEALEEAIIPSKAKRFAMSDRLGEQFGRYRLVRLLGSGGFAEVYLGQHVPLNTFAAIKVLHTRLSAKELAAFEKEAQIIANLRHPSIVRVLDYDAQGNIPFLVMDHAPEGTMRQFHARGSRLSLPKVVKYVKQIAEALQFAHNKKIIHRDVKPENMLIESQDIIMLSDFGLAVIAHSSRLARQQDKAGTAQYMAPEQFRGKPVPASDQYSLAVTAYEWLCGAPPFDEGNEIQLGFQHTMEPVPPLKDRGAVVSEEVEQVILKALAKEPTERFGSVKEFADELEKAAQVD